MKASRMIVAALTAFALLAGCASDLQKQRLSPADYKRRYLSLIAENILFPPMRITGVTKAEVALRLDVLDDGTVAASEIERSSGFAVLDDIVLAAVQRMGKLPPLPEEMREIGPVRLIIPVSFEF